MIDEREPVTPAPALPGVGEKRKPERLQPPALQAIRFDGAEAPVWIETAALACTVCGEVNLTNRPARRPGSVVVVCGECGTAYSVWFRA